MNFGKPYNDSMDPSRVVVPESSNGKTVRCQVFYRAKNGRLDLSGTAEIPVNLFSGSKFDPSMPERIGFVMMTRD